MHEACEEAGWLRVFQLLFMSFGIKDTDAAAAGVSEVARAGAGANVDADADANAVGGCSAQEHRKYCKFTVSAVQHEHQHH